MEGANVKRRTEILVLAIAFASYVLLGLPSGLVLYWFVNNLLGIAQQVVINRQIEAESPAEEAAGGAKKGKRKGKGDKAATRSQSK